MADLTVTGEVVVTSENAEAAFERVNNKATQMAKGVENAADKASKATEGMGDGAEKSAEKFTRAESRMRDAIKRSTQELQLLGKTASEKLEFNIQAKGLDASKFAPYIEELKKAEQAQKIATSGLDNMGMSARATAAAMRTVPAQLQDIFVSLQGGQAPMTVFLQQGSQLSTVFGGAGNAAKALGGYVLGLVNPFTIAAAGVAGLTLAYAVGSKEADGYRQALVLTGNQAGSTVGQMQQMAQQIAGVTGSQREAAAALAAFASSGKVGQENLRQFTQSAIEFSRVTGQSVDEVAKNFADLAKDPLKATLKLNEGMNFLTESIFRQIQSLQDQGRETEAANVAQKAYADTLNERKDEIVRNLGTIEKAWAAIKKEASFAMDAFLDIGRLSTLETRLQRAQSALQSYQGTLPGRRTTAQVAAVQEFGGEEGLKREIAGLEDLIANQRKSAEMERERATAVKASTDIASEALKYESDLEKQRRSVLSATEKYETALAKGNLTAEQRNRLEADYLKLVSGITEVKEKKGGASANKELNKELERQAKLLAELSGLSSSFAGDWDLLNKAFAQGKLTTEQLEKEQSKLLAKQPIAVAMEKERAAAIKESAKAAAESSKALATWYDAREKESQGFANQINARREEVTLMGLSTEAVVAYTQAKYEQQAAEKEAYAAALESASFYAGEYAEAYKTAAEAARQQAKQLRELGGLELEKGNKEAAKKAADEWQRAADDINRSLTDALLRGFESGKGFAQNLRDTISNMFRTLVLRPIISAVVNPIAGAVSGVVNGAVGSVGSNMLSSAGSSFLGNSFGGMGGFGSGFMSGFGETLAGSSFMGPSATLAGGATGFGATLGTIAPYALAAVALYSIIKSLDDSGTYHTGGAAQYNAATGLTSGQSGANFDIGFGRVEAGDQTISAVGTIAKSLGTALDGIAVAFGQTAGYEIATAFADDVGSKDGAWGALRISKDGKELLNWDDNRMSKWAPKEFADGEEGYKQYLAAVAKDTRQVLLDMDLPSWADKMLTSIGDSASMEDLTAVIQQIGVVQTAFVNMGRNLVGFADYSEEAKGALMELSGGIEALANNASTYYSNFYSASEQRDNLEKQLNEEFAKLNLTLPDVDATNAREQYRKLIEAQDSSTEEGRKAIAMLLELAGVFAQITVSGDEVAAQIANQRQSLEDRLLKAQGKDRELLDLQRKREYDALYKLDPALAKLVSQIYELEDASQAAAQAEADRVAAIDKSLRNLQAAYAREQKVLEARLDGLEQYRAYVEKQQTLQQESLSLITGVFDVLHSSVLDLYGSVSSTAAMQAEQGRKFIEQALGTALRTGYLPDQGQLSEAIQAARSGIDSGVYANTTEQDFAKLVLAGQLRALEEVAGKQKTDAEKQLDALQKQLDSIDDQTAAINKQIELQQDALDFYQEQIDIANGVYDATLSVDEAIRDIGRLLGLEMGQTKPLAVSGGGSGAGGAAFGGGGSSGAQAPARYSRLVYGGTAGVGYEGIRDQSLIDRLDKLSPVYHSFDGTVDLAGLAAAMKAAGGTIADLSILSGNYEGDWRKAFEGVGIPAFAVGTNYVPRDMLAQIHEGEAIVPKAFNPWANGGAVAGGDNTALITEIRSLRQEVAGLRAAAESTAAATGDTADVLVRVTNNGNGMVTAAAPI